MQFRPRFDRFRLNRRDAIRQPGVLAVSVMGPLCFEVRATMSACP